jgi:hypothetical protein
MNKIQGQGPHPWLGVPVGACSDQKRRHAEQDDRHRQGDVHAGDGAEQCGHELGPLAGLLFGFRCWSRSDLAHGAPEGVPVAIGAMLARRLNKLVSLGSRVFDGLGLRHGASRWLPIVGDLLTHREVRHV